MHSAILSPTINDYAEPGDLVELAKVAEQAGWDGFFIWDHLNLSPDGNLPLIDSTVAISAIAALTNRMILGPMITPVPRRRPWKLARELASLDRFTNGRMRLGVGLGGPEAEEFANFGENPDGKVRAKMLDEGLSIIEQLLKGERVKFDGEMYHLNNIQFSPPALQSPRLPVWVAAVLPFKAGQRRARQWDGIIPQKLPENELPADIGKWEHKDWLCCQLNPEEIRELVDSISSKRDTGTNFDVIATGTTFELEPEAAMHKMELYRQAGATWWCELLAPEPGSLSRMMEHVKRGPQLPHN